jgi:putative ABC transport system permease protein
MVRAILRKTSSDVRGRPLQVALLFLVIAAAATTLSVALNVQASASKPYERLRELSNGADVWVSDLGPEGDLAWLSGLASVTEVGEPYPISWEDYGLRKGERKQEVALVGIGPLLPEFDHPVVTKGRWLAEGGTSEIVVDGGAANVLGLEIGETTELLTPLGNRPFTIVGFAVTAGRNPAPNDDPGFAYVLPETLEALTPGAVYGSDAGHTLRVGARLANPDDPLVFLSEARASSGGSFNFSYWQFIRDDSTEANEFDIIFLQVFAIFALLASGLIIANAVGGQVLSQLRDIGILKAVGFTPRQVTATLLLQNVGLSLVASVAGVFVGLLVAPFFLKRSADILGVPASAPLQPVILAITVAVVTLIVALFTIVPAWRAGRVGAIQALTSGNDARMAQVSRLAQIATWLRLPRVVAVGVKDLSRRPARTAMTVAALVLAVITATFSLGIEATFDKTMSDPTVIGGPPYDIGADRDAYPDEQARAILEANPDIEEYRASLHTGARIGNRGFDLWAFEGDLNQPAWAMRSGRMPEQAGEAAISTSMAREFGLSVGQTLAIVHFASPDTAPDGTPRSEQIDVRIVGTFVSVEGEVMYVQRETIPGDEPATDYFIKTRSGADNRVVANDLIAASGGNLDPEVFSETIDDIRKQWRPVLLGLNLVLFAIAGINLLSSQLLSIRERQRDFGVLKTLGFTPAQIVASVLAGSAFLALVAVTAGIPLGLVAARVMFDILSNAAGIGTGVGALPGVVWLAPLVPLVLIVTAIASAVPARVASTRQIAEALRYE